MNTSSRKFAMAFLPLSGAIALTLTATPAVYAAEFADFLFVVDESGSMSSEHQWLGSMIFDLDAALQNRGIGTGIEGNRYGLVGFGNWTTTEVLGRSIGGGFFNTASDFSQATNNLVTFGGFEDGYSGIDFGFNNYAFRQGAAVNIVLITDEDRDIGNNLLTFESTLNSLQRKNALLNVAINGGFENGNGSQAIGVDARGNAFIANGTGGFTQTTGGRFVPSLDCSIVNICNGTTKADYIDLAWATGDSNVGGAAWDLNLLRAGGTTAESFTNAFVDIKVQEVSLQPGNPEPPSDIDTPLPPQDIPEPSSILGLFLLGVFGVVVPRKLKQQYVA